MKGPSLLVNDLSFLNQLNEIVKKIPAIMGAGRRFRVILNGESWFIFYPDALYGFIIEVYMGDLQVGMFSDRIGIHAETMVLCGDFATSGHHIFHRVVQPAVTVMHFESGNIFRQREQLMTETDSE